jgi:transposase-like protein
MKKYKKEQQQTTGARKTPQSLLDELVLLGAQRMVQQALEAEVTEYLGRRPYERHVDETQKHYRNGLAKKRHLTAGCGSFGIRVPRLREQYTSAIVDRYQRFSPQMTALIPQLYLHGLASGDFQQCFGTFLGSEAPLSETSILRQKQQWESEYQAWKKRPLEREYLYVWADGVYPKAGPKNEQMAVLVVIGLNCKGEKELLAIEEGYRESAESWREVFRDLKRHGLQWIGMMIADGVPGLWKALRDAFPTARRQRCWVHKMRNVLDKVPQTAYDEILQVLREIYHASSKDQALGLVKSFVAHYGHRYPKAVACLQESLDVLFSYFHFPRQHWKSIKSTNVIESLFSAVKLRTDAARRIPKRESALYLVFKLLLNQQQRLKKIHGYKLVPQTMELSQSTKNPKLRIAA